MVDDNPQDLVHDFVAEAVFGGHPLGRPVIGRAEVISTVSKRALATYHGAVYAHDNIVVAAAGNVKHERVLELLAARIPKTQAPARRVRKPFARIPPPGYRFQRKPTEQYHVCLGAPGISRVDDRRFAASLLDSILGGSASSRLFQEIREKRGMAYSVYSFASQYSDAGQIGLYLGTREENLVECLEIVARELSDVSAGNVRSGELERAKENLKGRMLLSLESTSNRMSRLGKSLITGYRAALARGARRAGRRGHRRRDRRARRRPAPARPALCRRNRAERGALQGRGAACQPGARRAQSSVKVFLLGRHGKVGSVLVPALEEAGHELVDSSRGADAAVDFTRPDAVLENVRLCLEDGVPVVIGTTGFDQDRVAALARRARAAGLLRAELRARGGADDALRRGGRQGAAGRRDRRAARRDEARCTLRDGEGDRRAVAGRNADPLGAPARPRRAPGW